MARYFISAYVDLSKEIKRYLRQRSFVQGVASLPNDTGLVKTMILNPIKTNDTCIEYFEDDSTAASSPYYTYTEYLKGYYQDNDFVPPTSSQTVMGRFASTNKTIGTVKLRLSPREMM